MRDSFVRQATIQHPPREMQRYLPLLLKRIYQLETLSTSSEMRKLKTLTDVDADFYSVEKTLREVSGSPYPLWVLSQQIENISDAFQGMTAKFQRDSKDYASGINVAPSQKTLYQAQRLLDLLEETQRSLRHLQQFPSMKLYQVQQVAKEEKVSPQITGALLYVLSQALSFQPWYLSVVSAFKEEVRTLVVQLHGRKVEELRPPSGNVETLYHTTINANEISHRGFTRGKSFGTAGMGGAKEGISFTSDLYVALAILRGLREAILISQGKVRLPHVLDWVRRDHLERQVLGEFIQSQGRPPKDTPWEVFQLYTRWMNSQTKRYNPLFYGIRQDTLNLWKSKSLKQVGVIVAKVNMSDPRIKFIPGMHEYRVPAESVMEIIKVIS